MYLYAQTNLQLYNQMIDAKYSEDDLLCISKGYELAIKLFSGQYRASGKSFLAHLVGTASILVAQGSPVNVVVAGILHSAYTQGNFGYGQKEITPAKQRYLAQAVGEEIEALVSSYTSFAWNDQAVTTARNRVNNLSLFEQQVILIRLANDLEDELDLGMLYCEKVGYSHTEVDTKLIVEIAFELGYSDLGKQLSEAFKKVAVANVPSILQRGEKSSFTISPVLNQPSTSYILKSIVNYLHHLLPKKLTAKFMRIQAMLRRASGGYSNAT